MPDNKRRPVIGKLIPPGVRSGFLEVGTSPTTPLEFKVLSPRGIIHSDMGGVGVGLGIVAALGNSSEYIPARKPTSGCHNPIESDPIAVNQVRIVGDLGMENEADSLEEEYTIVTHHKANKSYTKVYHGGFVTNQGIEIRNQDCIFNISPARFEDDMKASQPQASGFLSSCLLCNKRLHGTDIYMYRGEMAFCSAECRSRQIAIDERREKYCRSEASTSPSNGTSCQMLATGIFAI